MTERIRQIHVMSDCTYGRARVQAELRDMGLCVNHKRIERLMSQAKLRGVSRRRGFVVTTHRNPQAKAAPDLVKRQFTATGINQLWVADMTYVPTWAGFLYLAVVVDVYSRKVVGWAFGERMTSDLVIAALNMALHTRRPESVIHHNDRLNPPNTPAWRLASAVKRWVLSLQWERLAMRMTTPWLRVSSLPWSAS
jgi:putative transposase